MALTELQLPEKATFYSNVQNAATNMKRLMDEWQNMADFIANVDTDDLDAMGVAAGTVRTDLVQFRTVMQEFIDFFKGNSTTQTLVPDDIVDKIRNMR